jgi:RNA polymerase sigma factor (TIGR02999 family)
MNRPDDLAAHADITGALLRLRGGDAQAMNELFPLVYEALRLMAHRQRRRGGDELLTTTALVHETYLDLLGREPRLWSDRARFYAYAGRAMRSILVDTARRERAEKRGGLAIHVSEEDAAHAVAADEPVDVLALDLALQRLAALDEELVRVVELRFFAGLPVPEVAEVLGIAPRSVDRLWQKARALLSQLM